MVTFADLMSLLLTFFVLLLSFSNTEIVKFRTMAGSVKNALGLETTSPLAISDMPAGDTMLAVQSAKEGTGKHREGQEQEAKDLKRELEQILEQEGIGGKGEVQITERGVVLQLQGDLLFASGSSEIERKARTVLDSLAEYVRKEGRSVDVLGHTDDHPIATGTYPSNWELSAARAGQAVRYFSRKGVPAARMRAIGHADTVPIEPNTTDAGRAKNRCVEFVFVIGAAADTNASEPETQEPVTLADEVKELLKEP
jgi:chemotaxis protein MotB